MAGRLRSRRESELIMELAAMKERCAEYQNAREYLGHAAERFPKTTDSLDWMIRNLKGRMVRWQNEIHRRQEVSA